MKRLSRRWLIALSAILILAGQAVCLTSCGTTRSYWGVENEYYWGDDGHYHHHKPKKPKKHKKHKGWKHHHHHHDHDD